MDIIDKKIIVCGIGYIGLPTAAIYAKTGFETVGYDVNEDTVNALNEGKITIEEPHLDEIIEEMVRKKKLRGTTTMEEADCFFISVPTPINEDGTANLRYIEKACEEILPVLKKGNIVVLESTSPPGTTKNLVCKMLEKSGLNIGEDVLVAHTPERVIPGKILQELISNNRIVGGINKKSSEAVKEIFETFVKGKIIITDSTTAEMCKVMENTFRDVNIALANEMAIICEKAGISAWEVREIANLHPRVNLHIPGPGVGGHCIAIDPCFLVEKFPEETKLISLARKINNNMPHHTSKIIEKYSEKGDKIAVLGITFKPNVDDIRESPIIELCKNLQDIDRKVQVYDPHVKAYSDSLDDTLKDASVVVLAVNHDAFADMDFEKILKLVKKPVIIDTRDQWEEKLAKDSRFKYVLLGSGEYD